MARFPVEVGGTMARFEFQCVRPIEGRGPTEASSSEGRQLLPGSVA